MTRIIKSIKGTYFARALENPRRDRIARYRTIRSERRSYTYALSIAAAFAESFISRVTCSILGSILTIDFLHYIFIFIFSIYFNVF